jgi:hypothetical protein
MPKSIHTTGVCSLKSCAADILMADSAAAGVHSTIGNVASGSLFATLQSAGAGGTGAAMVNGAVQGVGVAVAGVSVGVKYVRSRMSKL